MKKSLAKGIAVALCCVALLAAFALSACGGSAPSESSSQDQAEPSAEYKLVHPGVLTVATSPDYAPMEYQESGEIKGYDIALIKEIAGRLGLSADIQKESFDSLVAQVALSKEYDCAISSITVSNERAELVAFTDPYFDSNLAIVVMGDGAITNRSQLAGKPIGAQSGSSGEEWAKENLQGSPYTPFQETSDMIAALSTGKISAAVFDQQVAAYLVSTDYDECSILEVIPTGEQYGIIVNTANVPLAEAINDVLAEMLADGTIAKLRAEWFDEK